MSMDEVRSTLFSAGLRRLLIKTLHPGERVLWQGQPDAIADMMMWRFLWWVGIPWLVLSAVAVSRGWIDQSATFFLMSGAIMIAAPFVMLLYDLQTLCVITDRRALILRTAWGKRTVTGNRLQGHGPHLRNSRHQPRRRPPEFCIGGFDPFSRCRLHRPLRVSLHSRR